MTSSRFKFPSGERVSCRSGVFWFTFGRMEKRIQSFGVDWLKLNVTLYLDDGTEEYIHVNMETYGKFAKWANGFSEKPA